MTFDLSVYTAGPQ